MSDRQKVAMSEEEIATFLTENRKMQLATIGPDGSPHLVTMFYVALEGKIAFWTYNSSQKAVNMARDPRVSCLIEDGVDYFDLRGVQVRGEVRTLKDPGDVLTIGRHVSAELTGVPTEGLDQFIEYTARKRWGYIVEPTKVSSWDHRKLFS